MADLSTACVSTVTFRRASGREKYGCRQLVPGGYAQVSHRRASPQVSGLGLDVVHNAPGSRPLFLALPRILCAGYAGCIMTRRRSSGKPARPYIWRLTVLILLTVPSTLPELYGRLSPLRTASLS